MIKSVSLVTSTRFLNFTFIMQILLLSHILDQKKKKVKKKMEKRKNKGSKQQEQRKRMQ